MAERVTLSAPAKVNLRLCILAREQGGYHALETVFCALSLADEVEVSRGGSGARLAVEGEIDTGPPERNLALRAAHVFYREIGRAPATDIRLAKRIPSAAGLGGGSSDAAAVLRALNTLEGEPLARIDLLRLAIELGADVPFFLCGSPLALAWGRGERLMALPPLPRRPVLIAHPGVAMPTAEAFREVAALRGETYVPTPAQINADALADWDRIAARAVNDFEPVVARRIPVLDDGLAVLRSAGARLALLAGSGSSIFGVFDDDASRDDAEPALASLGLRTWRAETLGEMPAPRLA